MENQKKEFVIGKTKVGGSNPCFIVAEIGINFNGKYENALKLIDTASKAGCNAVKFQLFSADKMYTPSAGEDKSGKGRKKDIYKIVKESELPVKWISKLKDYANKLGLEFFSTVCDEGGVDTLERFGVDAFKIASYEITHLPLLHYVAKNKKPIIFSCGASNIKEVVEALKVFKKEKNEKIALLHCVAKYGADLSSLNLNIIKTLQLKFPEVIIGYSDHSADPIKAPVAAVALGAKIIEKHITLDKKMPGPDHFFALEPKELDLMVKAIRDAEEKIKKEIKIKIAPELLGSAERKVFEDEKIPRDFTHRCIFATKDIKKGEILDKNNIAVLRPGNEKKGLEPQYYHKIIGCKSKKNISKYKGIVWGDIFKQKNSEISVIVRTYNSAKTVRETLDNALNQNINAKDYEIVMVDDGSSDSTINILKEYGKKLRVIEQKHSGHVNATNRGISESRGEFITLLDSDDIFIQGALKEMKQAFTDATIDFVYCDYFEENRTGQRKIISLKENIFKGLGGGIMFRKKVFDELGLFDKSFIFAEYDFLVRLIKTKKKGKHIPIPLYVYRRNEKSLTFNKEFVENGLKQLEVMHGRIVDKIRKY